MEEFCNKICRGRPKKAWWETLKHDKGYDGLIKIMAMDIDDCKYRIHLANPPSGIKGCDCCCSNCLFFSYKNVSSLFKGLVLSSSEREGLL